MICRMLNEDPVLSQIRKDNNVTYKSSSQRNESVIVDNSPVIKGSYNNSAIKNDHSNTKNNHKDDMELITI